ncbi:MAG: FkbM family methyltransferase [Planctomycetes bacterium]|nr:FkbM family methyltransferase [Planctomycetota bacterium]
MTLEHRNTLYRRLHAKGFAPAHVAEVGVYVPETSNVYDYIQAGVRTTLAEPDPSSIARLERAFGDKPCVTLHKVAVYDFNGPLKLAQREASTFVSELPASPAIVNDGYRVSEDDCFEVQAVTFDRIDDGSIELLSVDTEGSEWFVLKHMTSRPGVIAIETHGAAYLNPHLAEIEAWMAANGYRGFYKDKSDTVYVHKDAVRLTFAERVALRLKSAALALRRARKRLLR